MSDNIPRVLVYGMSPFYGGVENFIMNYYRNIDKNKIQFDFLVYDKYPAFSDEIIDDGGDFEIVTGRRTNFFKNFIELNRFFKYNHHKYVAIWCNLCSLSDILPLKLAKKYGINTRIVHSHNSQNMNGKLTYILHSENKKALGKYATEFWACSRLAGKWMFGKAIFDRPEFRVINNAIDVSKFKFSREIRTEKRKELGIDNKFVVGHVGRFHFQKNHEFLIDIFKKVYDKDKDAVLVLIGVGVDEEKIKMKVSDLGLDKAVKFLGVRSDIPDLMQTMDVFVLPSRFEGLPVVGVEAQAAGLPCLFSNKITKEVSIIEGCVFLSLEEEPGVWADEVLKYKSGYERKDTTQQIIDAGFEIQGAANRLQNFYLKCR